jgi:DNA-directed RNA polymerase subunit M/transcription elongation factor TFIIS
MITAIEQIKCPKCGWTSRVVYLASTNSYKCEHCGNRWKGKV